jgi:hypothetical protein
MKTREALRGVRFHRVFLRELVDCVFDFDSSTARITNTNDFHLQDVGSLCDIGGIECLPNLAACVLSGHDDVLWFIGQEKLAPGR